MRLSEYVLQQTMTGETDLELITRFLTEENLQSEALMIIPTLARDKVKKVETKLNNVRSWAPYVMGLKLHNKKGTLTDEAAHKLEVIILMFLCDLELDKTSWIYEWAVENIPKMDIPFYFFRPTLDYLAKYNIYFKNGERKNE